MCVCDSEPLVQKVMSNLLHMSHDRNTHNAIVQNTLNEDMYIYKTKNK